LSSKIARYVTTAAGTRATSEVMILANTNAALTPSSVV
jgi:hypothetical protein